jgi:hypothetical protein
LAVPTVGLYTALFANEAAVTDLYTRGSFYAALPVLTAFAFSIVHGAFASQCLEALGITAKKSATASTTITKEKESTVKKDTRPRLNVN